MNTSIRTLAMLGLAAGLGMAGSVRADDAVAKGDTQDQIEDLRAELGTMTAQINNIQGMAKGMIEVHGFAETDLYNDTTGSFSGNNSEVVGNQAVKLSVPGFKNYLNDNGMTQASVRNSRIDFLAQKELNGWKTKGYIEFDLLGYDPTPNYGLNVSSSSSGTATPNSEGAFFTNPTLRVRHAYLDAQSMGWDFMAGQYWTLLGWNMDYTLATVSVAPIMGVLYQRTPQVRAAYTYAMGDFKTQLAADAERPSERESDMLNYSQGIRFSYDGWNGSFATATGASKSMPLSVAITGTEREFKWANTASANYDYDVWGQALALDTLIPVLPFDGKDSYSLVVTGEWSAGSGYGDEFPSWNPGNGGDATAAAPAAQGSNGNLSALSGNPDIDSGLGFLDLKNGKGVSGLGNFTLIENESWNAQMQFHLPPSIGTFFTFGYSYIDSPNISDLVTYSGAAADSKVYNSDSGIFINAMQDFGPSIRVGVEYASFVTHYAGGADTKTLLNNTDGMSARDNRLQLSTWYRF